VSPPAGPWLGRGALTPGSAVTAETVVTADTMVTAETVITAETVVTEETALTLETRPERAAEVRRQRVVGDLAAVVGSVRQVAA